MINMITKSGTSDFHIVADEYLRNPKLDANTYLNKLEGTSTMDWRPSQSVRHCRRRSAVYPGHLQATQQDLLFRQLRGLAAQ